MPYAETAKADTQMSFYAATKKATEAMAHSYAHLYDLPTTMFRFFTVYGPWGRPDMAPYKFTRAILAGDPIDVYNHGDMSRDFTYIDDLVDGIAPADRRGAGPACARRTAIPEGDSLSPVAPYRIREYRQLRTRPPDGFHRRHRGGDGPHRAGRPSMDMQPGDVAATWADATLLQSLTGYRPKTDIRAGVALWVAWFSRLLRDVASRSRIGENTVIITKKRALHSRGRHHSMPPRVRAVR